MRTEEVVRSKIGRNNQIITIIGHNIGENNDFRVDFDGLVFASSWCLERFGF